LDTLSECAAQPVPRLAATALTAVRERASADLMRALDAGGAFVALRSDAEFQRRLHELGDTHERLLRETPEARTELSAALAAERQRVADIFAVGVEAELQSVSYVTTTLVDCVARLASGNQLGVTVDLGRGMVLPPDCAVCGGRVSAGALCPRGHVTCAACLVTVEAGRCPSCDAAEPQRLRQPHQPRRRPGAKPSAALSAEQLDQLSPESWRAFVAWYLAADGHATADAGTVDGLPCWRLGHNGAAGLAVALRLDGGHWLDPTDLRVAGRMSPAGSASPVTLITTANASAAAKEAAALSGLRLIDRSALAVFVERAAEASARACATAGRDAEARAAAAVEARATLLAALHDVEAALAGAVNARRATRRGAVVAAATTISAAVREVERALLAWETLIADWHAVFDERAARDGSLAITASPEALKLLRGRAGHLRDALLPPLRALAATPSAGEAGYGAWRKAVLEQFTLSFESLRWRVLEVDPSRWHDPAAARDIQALAQAESAATAARYAAARAAKAYGQLAERAGLARANDVAGR
ncbi:MAG: hypothetical protein ACHQ4H_17310, partial [Ktedonobacterales bacterium]